MSADGTPSDVLRAGVNRTVASCLTVPSHKIRVEAEVVTTFSSFQVP